MEETKQPVCAKDENKEKETKPLVYSDSGIRFSFGADCDFDEYLDLVWSYTRKGGVE